jgi:2-oxoisovalerate dehydrogenase E1 component alpha subunit
MTIAARYEIEYLQYLGADGALVAEPPAALADPKVLLPLFKQMLFVRVFDTKAIALQRTGKLGTYASCLGHEATHVGIGASMRPEDVFAPSYREYGAQFMRGVQPREVLLYWGGDERGNDFAGPKHWPSSCARKTASRSPAAAMAARPRPTSTPRSTRPARTPRRWCCA